MTEDELARVEELVNGYIMDNADVISNEMSASDAMESGATALFGEKYGERVRVVRVGEVSMELCGGTHVQAAGEIGLFKILSEAGIAAGVRRIEALTGTGALRHVQELEEGKRRIASMLKSEGSDPLDKLEKLLARQREMQREIEALQGKLNSAHSADLLAEVREVNGVKLLAVQVNVANPKGLRELSDTLKDRIGSGIIVLGAATDGKANLLVAISDDLTGRFKAGDIIRQLAPIVGGSGGGKPDLAQAGGNQPDNIKTALDKAAELIV
jgi:alanyl-tRNA synthetase